MPGAAASFLERELKLDVDPSFSLPELDGTPLEPRLFTSTYHDTPDRRLARSGLTLRRRVEGGKSLWQLKLPRDEGRLEIEAPGVPARPPEAIASLLGAVLRSARLAPVSALRTRRSGVLVGEGESGVQVVLDEVTVLDGMRVTETFSEVELEARGPNGDLDGLAKQLRKAGARESDGRPKVFRVLGVDDAGPARDAPAPEHVRAMLDRQYRELLARDPAVRAEDDAEDVHQFRVATRRFRAILRAAAPVLVPEWAEGLRAELGWLADALGAVRDLDVLLEYLREEAESLEPAERAALEDALIPLEKERAATRKTLRATLDDPRYRTLLDTVEDAVRAPRFATTDFAVSDFASAEYRRLRRAVKALADDDSDDALHSLRIRGKRARYAAEMAEGERGKPATAFVAATKRLQDVLGDHQDASVAEERLRATARRAGRPDVWFATGRLVERQAARRRAARAALPDAWNAVRKAGRRAWS
jgi:CHAD domain-containing protein